MAITIADLKLKLRALVGGGSDPGDSDVVTAVSRVFEREVTYVKTAADSMAADVTANQHFFYARRAGRVLLATYLPLGTCTAHATNFATLILNKDTNAGADTVVASRATDTVTTDDMAVGVGWALDLSATDANKNFAAGDALGFQITKGGSGVVVPTGRLIVFYEEL